MTTNPVSAASSAALMTASLRALRECVRDINPARLSESDIELLHGIADFALAHVHEARWLLDERQATLSQAVEYEVFIQAKIAAESDAADHEMAHLV
jgi:hypothetical protein